MGHMPFHYEFRFFPDGRVEQFCGSRGNYYEFQDGSRLDMYTTPVWCRRCCKITHGEKADTVEEIDQQLADLRNPRSELYRYLAKDFNYECKDLEPLKGSLLITPLRRRPFGCWRTGEADGNQ